MSNDLKIEIEVRINGEKRPVPAGLTIRTLLDYLNIDPSRVAVECNRTIIRAAHWDCTPVEAGFEFEIVEFVGGGTV